MIKSSCNARERVRLGRNALSQGVLDVVAAPPEYLATEAGQSEQLAAGYRSMKA